ncbi:hypothetical protein PsYK624_082110 [Phanerochaete sordida]|uniref:Secreted protein n=1 Tax=Phanerochaete sordida TaxID=48140 RepID=A0A9P3G9U9_9APHY|nr:hypothetical protein PsYK624_082110 [Phanerochaete sordida]
MHGFILLLVLPATSLFDASFALNVQRWKFLSWPFENSAREEHLRLIIDFSAYWSRPPRALIRFYNPWSGQSCLANVRQAGSQRVCH